MLTHPVVTYNETIESRRVLSAVQPGYLRELLPAAAPEQGEAWRAIQADVENKIMPGITHWQSPNFMAFFPCAASYPAVLADLYSDALNGAHFNWICSPAVTELETVMMDWLARALALPESYLSSGRGGGVIQATASDAIVVAMVAARDKHLREALASQEFASEEAREDAFADRRGRLVALGSAAAHSSTKKAAQVLGLRFAAVPVRREDGYAMQGAAVAETVRALRARGLEPFYLTATYGTTDTCAVDDMAGIAAALAEAGPEAGSVWVHVDAAYAGAALICPEYQSDALQGALDRFHSFNFNAHKWLLTNFDCSCLWVRDRAWLVEALSIKPPYLRNQFSEAGLVTDYRDWQIALGRRFRSLKLWFVMRSYGLEGLRAHLRGGIRLAEGLAAKLESRKDLFEMVAGPAYALVVFRCVGPPGADEKARNELTERVYEAINHEGEIYLTSSVLDGLYAIRVCTGVPSVREEHVQKAFDIIVAQTEKALAA